MKGRLTQRSRPHAERENYLEKQVLYAKIEAAKKTASQCIFAVQTLDNKCPLYSFIDPQEFPHKDLVERSASDL